MSNSQTTASPGLTPPVSIWNEVVRKLRLNSPKNITRNVIKCLSCGDVIESKHVHDFVTCKCKSVCVDGGHEYLRRAGNLANYEELSEYDET